MGYRMRGRSLKSVNLSSPSLTINRLPTPVWWTLLFTNKSIITYLLRTLCIQSLLNEHKVILPSLPISSNTIHGFDQLWVFDYRQKAAKSKPKVQWTRCYSMWWKGDKQSFFVGLEANLLIHLSAGVLRKVHLCQVTRAQVTLSSSGCILLRKDAKV